MRAPTVCSDPRCYELAARGGKCPRCRRAERRASDSRRPTSRQRGYDARWEATRKGYLAAHPVCEDDGGCREPATDVDHIDGRGPLGARGHDWTNLRALCHSHHSKRTARDQPGGWNR